MKVAQQFIAGFAFLNRSRPDRDDRVAFAPVKPRSKVVAINSIVPGGTARSKTNVDPALPCWATFIRPSGTTLLIPRIAPQFGREALS
jgi:hypothetical protein